MLNLIYGLLALAVVIALIGIANTLALSVHERTRELGLLRAVGMSRSQLRRAVRWEAVLIALLGTALGVGLGRRRRLGHRSRPWRDEGVTAFTVPPTQVGIIVGLAVLAGVGGRPRPGPSSRPSSTCWTPSPASRGARLGPGPVASAAGPGPRRVRGQAAPDSQTFMRWSGHCEDGSCQ